MSYMVTIGGGGLQIGGGTGGISLDNNGGVSTGNTSGSGDGGGSVDELLGSATPLAQNESADGKVVPTWIGASPDARGEIVWLTPIRNDGKVDFAVCFGRNEFDRDFKYITIKGDRRIIWSAKGEDLYYAATMRRYNSADNVVDPLLLADKGAALANSMIGYLVVFFEDFDTTRFENRIPVITAEIADTTIALTEGDSLEPDGALNGSIDIRGDLLVTYQAGATTSGRLVAFRLPDGTKLWDVSVPAAGIFSSVHIVEDGRIIISALRYDQVYIFAPLTGVHLQTVSFEDPPIVDPNAPFQRIDDVTVDDRSWVFVGHFGAIVALVDYGLGYKASWNESTGLSPGTLSAGPSRLYFINGTGDTLYSVGWSPSGLLGSPVASAVVGPQPHACHYDAGSNSVIVLDGEDEQIYVLNAGLTAVLRSTESAVDIPTSPSHVTSRRMMSGADTFFVKDWNTNDLAEYRLSDLALLRTIDASAVNYVNDDGSFISFGVSPETRTMVVGGNADPVSLWQFPDSTEGADAVPLADVLALLATRRGYDLSDIVTSGLSGLSVYSCYLNREIGIKTLINQICEIFGVDPFESGNKYKFVKIGRDGNYAVNRVLEAEDFIQNLGNNPLTITGAERFDGDVPASVSIEYLDPTKGYTVASQEALRPLGIFSENAVATTATLSAPIAITPALAKALAYERAYEYDAGRKVYKFGLPPEHSDIEPADVLTIPVLGEARDVKVTRVVLREDYAIEVSAQDVLVATDSSVSAAETTYEPPAPPSQDTLFYWLDGPQLADADASNRNLRVYGLLSGTQGKTWAGGKVKLPDQGDLASTVTPVVGRANTIVAGPAANWSTDYDNVINVRLISGSADDVASATHDEVMADANLAFFGRPGRWEIIQWETVTIETNGTLTLGILQRGRLGSEVWQDIHAYDDYFIPVDRETLLLFTADPEDLDEVLGYKYGGIGLSKDEFTVGSATVTGTAEKPYAPTDLNAVIDGPDIEITWNRRSRLRPSYVSGVWTVPLGETTESYDIVIMDGDTIARTLSAVTNSVTYTALQIATDFGTMPATLTFKVYQISARVGRGFAATATITL